MLCIAGLPIPMRVPGPQRRPRLRGPALSAADMDEDMDEDDLEYDDDDDDGHQQAPVHRTFFPETWLWRIERMRSVGYWVIAMLCRDWSAVIGNRV